MTRRITVGLPDDQARSLQRRRQALADLEKIRAQPYEELDDFHRAALACADLDD